VVAEGKRESFAQSNKKFGEEHFPLRAGLAKREVEDFTVKSPRHRSHTLSGNLTTKAGQLAGFYQPERGKGISRIESYKERDNWYKFTRLRS